eukprot:scaffold1828_cov62-Phaeocystis_antarctica.AAC.3
MRGVQNQSGEFTRSCAQCTVPHAHKLGDVRNGPHPQTGCCGASLGDILLTRDDWPPQKVVMTPHPPTPPPPTAAGVAAFSFVSTTFVSSSRALLDVGDAQFLSIVAICFVQTINFQVVCHKGIQTFEGLADGVRDRRGAGQLHVI